MKLLRLELAGFKSFADAVMLTFDDGVTAIVGPNGCGKSNVSDGVRWVLGEQSARILRGGKMEDVIFQGSQSRKPVNVAEVSLVLDNSEGTLPIAFREVVITRRLSRSGQSDYLLNGSQVRLRDIQDLLRGTGLGGDAGVVIEADMIQQLLSDRADERRSLFEDAAGIGLYRDRKHSSERRLEETATDLQRVEDLIAEKQSQLRSLARQRTKAERHVKLMEEKFSVSLTLGQAHLTRLGEQGAVQSARADALVTLLPETAAAHEQAEVTRTVAAEMKSSAEATRTSLARRLGEVKVDVGRLDGDLRLVAERLQNGTDRRRRGADERATQQGRAAAAAEELASADADRTEADVALARVREHVSGRQQEEERLRQALGQRREAVRRLEQESQQTIAKQRTLEGERTSREHDLHIQRERATKATDHRGHLRGEQTNTERRRDQLVERVGFLGYESRRAKDRLQDARRLITTTRETDAACRTARRDAEQALAALAARRNALEALERDRVGLAPAAAALLAARAKFGDGILGPLSDYVAVDSADAELAERLLGDLMHAVLVKDASVIDAVRAWHGQAKPGALVLLPVAPGPTITGATAYDARLRVQEPATGWVQAVLAGSEALDETGQVLRRATGAIYLSGAAPQSGPLRRRAELAELAISVAAADAKVAEAEAAQKAVIEQLAAADKALAEAQTAADLADRTERDATAQRDDALRTLANLARELVTAEQELERIGKRITDDANRLTEIADTLTTITTERERAEAALAEARLTLQTIETEQEAAREQRTQAQVEEAQLAARLRTSTDRVARATQTRTDAERNDQRLAEELGRLDGELATLSAQRDEWATTRETIAAELAELESEAGAGEQSYAAAVVALADADRTLQVAREDARRLADESHKLDLARAEAQGLRTRIIERLEQEWRKSIDALFVDFTALDMDFETLENESARITSQLEAIGPVNPLAVEEHAEEAKKVEFLMTQRDDLVSARQSLIQAIREIDGTARQLFIEMFNQIRDNFKLVFQRMFDGGECELRLADPDNPLDCEIEILGAPRGKRIQNVRLLSMGEKTLVATSLLFGLYLTKPSPFCLMDEVDAPLDDANVGRFVRLLEEFKPSTQFLIITHNPRTMQSADAVYGVTMQEPGISTIVGVRLGEAAV